MNTSLFSNLLSIGSVSSVSASFIKLNLARGGSPSSSLFDGVRYGLGEVSEFIVVESEQSAIFGRITEVKLPDNERLSIQDETGMGANVNAIAYVQLLATISLQDLRVKSGIESYPRLGDKVYAAPHEFIARIPELMSKKEDSESPNVTLDIGHIKNAKETSIQITPEKLFGRHCAILGATGGGKSYTMARLLEETKKHKSKVILLDATGEYRDIDGQVEHYHLGSPFPDDLNPTSQECSLPPTSFLEQDFIALFEPSGKVQGPKLRAAIRSLKLANVMPQLATEGIINKVGEPRRKIARAEYKHSSTLQNPSTQFDQLKLPDQIVQECVVYYEKDIGIASQQEVGYCLSLLTRINGILTSDAFKPVFQSDADAITEKIENYIKPNNPNKLLRICLSGIHSDYDAREIITNAIGRHLLSKAREGALRQNPILCFLDEAHGFIGKSIGADDYRTKLNSFDIIAKEGRKYGLNLCLATQRPRDLPEGVISQMGTLLVHRLSNDKDREMVERACGEIDRSASSFLPNLQAGEVALLGVDFPIPMTIQIHKPNTPPQSDGADFQTNWVLPTPTQ